MTSIYIIYFLVLRQTTRADAHLLVYLFIIFRFVTGIVGFVCLHDNTYYLHCSSSFSTLFLRMARIAAFSNISNRIVDQCSFTIQKKSYVSYRLIYYTYNNINTMCLCITTSSIGSWQRLTSVNMNMNINDLRCFASIICNDRHRQCDNNSLQNKQKTLLEIEDLSIEVDDRLKVNDKCISGERDTTNVCIRRRNRRFDKLLFAYRICCRRST